MEIDIQLKPKTQIIQQKARPVPIHLQDAVGKEIDRLIKSGHIEKANDLNDDSFISPAVITVKKDKSVKIALDARELNKNIVKDKYLMPNSEHLMDLVAEQVTQNSNDTWFSSIDLQYAYGQVALDELTKRHCNFQIVGGDATG